jgi:hypothetical protein
MLPNNNPMMAATTTKMAVHAPWVESELKPMEMPSMAEAARKVKSK